MRSRWKFPFLAKFVLCPNLFQKRLLLRSRNILISKGFVGKKLSLYNGKWYQSLNILNNHLGYRLGSLVPTRRCDIGLHAKKKSKKNIKKR